MLTYRQIIYYPRVQYKISTFVAFKRAVSTIIYDGALTCLLFSGKKNTCVIC
jgi:hypothetical protein